MMPAPDPFAVGRFLPPAPAPWGGGGGSGGPSSSSSGQGGGGGGLAQWVLSALVVLLFGVLFLQSAGALSALARVDKALLKEPAGAGQPPPELRQVLRAYVVRADLRVAARLRRSARLAEAMRVVCPDGTSRSAHCEYRAAAFLALRRGAHADALWGECAAGRVRYAFLAGGLARLVAVGAEEAEQQYMVSPERHRLFLAAPAYEAAPTRDAGNGGAAVPPGCAPAVALPLPVDSGRMMAALAPAEARGLRELQLQLWAFGWDEA